MAMTFLSLVLVRIQRKWGATLKKTWETRDQMFGPKPDDQKELRILNRTLRCWQGWVGLCCEFETSLRGCQRAGTEQVETNTIWAEMITDVSR